MFYCLVCYLLHSLWHIIQIIRHLMDYSKPNNHLIKIINRKIKILTSISQRNNFDNTGIYKLLCNCNKLYTRKINRNFKIKYKTHTW